LYYEITGSGRSLVFLHAGIADSRMWDEQFWMFAPTHRVLRYDLRGFGISAPVSGTFSHRQDLCSLLDFLQIGKASLVGLSLGGQLALDFALEWPDRVESLILMAALPRGQKKLHCKLAVLPRRTRLICVRGSMARIAAPTRSLL
jgi:pimeloyl-ACP methyl ester carboxylesterase